MPDMATPTRRRSRSVTRRTPTKQRVAPYPSLGQQLEEAKKGAIQVEEDDDEDLLISKLQSDGNSKAKPDEGPQ